MSTKKERETELFFCPLFVFFAFFAVNICVRTAKLELRLQPSERHGW